MMRAWQVEHEISAIDVRWFALESLRQAVNWDIADVVFVRIGQVEMMESRLQGAHDPPRGLDLTFDEAAIRASGQDVRGLVLAAIMAHVPWWRFEAHAHYPSEAKR